MAIELNPISSGYSTGLINNNFEKIEEEINDNVLRRDGLSPGEANQMNVPLDMNSNYIINAVTDLGQPGSLITVGEADNRYLNLTGGTMQGSLNMASYPVFVRVAINGSEPARKDQLDQERSDRISADAALSQKIDQEVGAIEDRNDEFEERLVGEIANRSRINQQIRQEFQRADANLQDQILAEEPLEASAFSPISWHDQSIDNSVDIPADKNAWSFGPEMTISPGQAVTVGEGSHWTIAAKQISLEDIDNRVSTLEAEVDELDPVGIPSFTSINQGLADTESGEHFTVYNDGDHFQALYLNNMNMAELVSQSATFANLPTSEDSAGEGNPYRAGERVYIARNLDNYYKFNWGNYISTVAEQYALWDDLADAFPNYVSRFSLGQDAYGTHIYAYSLKPPSMYTDNWGVARSDAPQVLVVGGLHGHEKNSQLANLTLARELCWFWKEIKDLDTLRWCTEIVFVPCSNPSGIDDHTRKNRNGVDLGRNFPIEWTSGGSNDPESNFYRGPSAGSEPETQAIMTLATHYPNAIAALDHHNSAGLSSQGFGPWIGTRNEEDLDVALKTLRESERWARREMPEIEDFTGTFLRVSSATSGGCAAWFSVEADIPGYLLESPQAGGLGGQFYQRKIGFELLKSMIHNVYTNSKFG